MLSQLLFMLTTVQPFFGGFVKSFVEFAVVRFADGKILFHSLVR